MDKKTFGKLAEDHACAFLLGNGYEILFRNFRWGRFGEIDIVAKNGSYFCFIEVKARSNTTFGTPAEAVNADKRRKIRTLAQVFMSKNGLNDVNVRFDVIEVFKNDSQLCGSADLAKYRINLIINAF